MEEQNFNMKNTHIIAVVLIVIILIALICYSYFEQEKINTQEEQINANNNANENVEEVSNNLENNVIDEFSVIDIDYNSETVQKVAPLTGAFPENDIRLIAKTKFIKREELTNDFILKFAFSKITKDDWAASYEGEGSIVSFDADLLDKKIKDIFGNIEYEKTNFDNLDLSLEDSSNTSLYTAIYNSVDNRYSLQFLQGDGVDDSIVLPLNKKSIKKGDKLILTMNVIYLKNLGQELGTDGAYHFAFNAYQHYNFETKSFVSRLSDNFYDVYPEVDEATGEPILNSAITQINYSNLESYTITYYLNQETGNYEFESLSAK